MQEKAKVLVIDNGLGLAETTREAAESSTWEATLASGEKEALAKALDDGVGVIVLGYLAPQGESFRVHRLLKEDPETADTPQVIVDAAPEEKATKGWRKNEGLMMDAEEYLCAPVTPEALARAVDRVLARSEVAGAV
jgi:CheY-like chemotaxis protein